MITYLLWNLWYVTLSCRELQLSLVPNILTSERLFVKILSQLNEPRNLRMKDFVVTEQRGTLLPSDVMWNHQIAGRKSLPHTLADYCRICVGLLCPAFIFPGGALRFRNKNPAPTFWKYFWKVFRFYPRFVTKRSVGKHQGSLSKVHSEAVSKMCNHLKINYFQKMFPNWPFSQPT